jgi:hypothetical protein
LVISPRPLHTAPGVLVAEEPLQQPCPENAVGDKSDYKITAVATYNIRARVLSTKHYYANQGDLVPYDVALGWGRMSDQTYLDKMDISQGNRFYFYQWEGNPPLPEKEIIAHSSNNHLIAANRSIAWKISRLRAGEVVTLTGYLVNVTGPESFRWQTSLTRTDTGNGACEVMYVESIKEETSPVPVPEAPAASPVAAAPKA